MGVSLISLDSTFVIAGKEHMLRLCDLSNMFRLWCPRQELALRRSVLLRLDRFHPSSSYCYEAQTISSST